MPIMPIMFPRPAVVLLRQPAEAQDEEHGGDEVGDDGEWRWYVHDLGLLPEHGEHAAGDEEAAADVDGGEEDGEDAENDRGGIRSRSTGGACRRG